MPTIGRKILAVRDGVTRTFECLNASSISEDAFTVKFLGRLLGEADDPYEITLTRARFDWIAIKPD